MLWVAVVVGGFCPGGGGRAAIIEDISSRVVCYGDEDGAKALMYVLATLID